jgi:broad specificity phosphatase PhoE
MGTIYVVRHAQAAFGTDDYDRLTQTGIKQARLLGGYLSLRNVRFDAVYTGCLRRHAQTTQGIFENLEACETPSPQRFPGLDEYNSDALVSALEGAPESPDPVAALRDPVMMRKHFRVLREALLAWTEDRIQPVGLPVWREFQDSAVAALVEARQSFPDGNVLVVSSGGPIAAIVAATLKAPAQSAIELNLRMRNSSITEFASSARRHTLVTFNTLPHLETHPYTDLITYA